KPLVQRKAALFSDFSSFYKILSAKGDSQFSLDRTKYAPDRWGRYVYNKLKKEYKEEKARLAATGAFNQKNYGVDLISSSSAWYIVWRKVYLRKGSADEVLFALQNMLDKTANKYESLAINLYIARLKLYNCIGEINSEEEVCRYILARRFWARPIALHPAHLNSVREEICQLTNLFNCLVSGPDREFVSDNSLPRSIFFNLLGRDIARSKIAFDEKMLKFGAQNKKWRGYLLEGFLDEEIILGQLDISIIKRLLEKADQGEVAVISIYLGRLLYLQESQPKLESLKKLSRSLGANWDHLSYGLGIQSGLDFFENKQKFFSLREEFEKSMTMFFYPGFGRGIAGKLGLEASSFKRKIKDIPNYLKVYCYLGWGENLLEISDFDFEKAALRISKENISKNEKNFAFRGLGLAVAHWYFNELIKGAVLLKKIKDTDFRYDCFYGMQDFIYHYGARWGKYDPRAMGSIISKSSGLEKH
ncbi:MAG: hypothetical protein PHC29_08510, partial [Candidatus Omnitrophica bacterium]|nr:hypothetical protein [Candidatus Omnitrophota bacterium]